MKGTVGNEVKVTLMDFRTNDVSQTQPITLSDWKYYSFSLKASMLSNRGRIKLNFLDQGTYFIDGIHVTNSPVN